MDSIYETVEAYAVLDNLKTYDHPSVSQLGQLSRLHQRMLEEYPITKIKDLIDTELPRPWSARGDCTYQILACHHFNLLKGWANVCLFPL